MENPFLSSKITENQSNTISTNNTVPFNKTTLPTTRQELEDLLIRGYVENDGYFLYSLGIGTAGPLVYEEENKLIVQAENTQRLIHLKNGLEKVDTVRDELGKRTSDDMNRTWVTVNKAKNLTSELIINLTYKNHRTLIKDAQIKEKLNQLFINLLDEYLHANKPLEIVKNVYIKMILWAETVIPKLLEVPVGSTYKSLVIENNSKRDSSVFLHILAELGFVVYYRSMGGIAFETGSGKETERYATQLATGKLYDGNVLSNGDYTNLLEKERAEQREAGETIRTAALDASEEIQEILNGDAVGILRDWQFENSHISSKRLKTTYDELLILWDEPANMRSGFSYNKVTDTVTLPTIFAKVSGVHSDIEKYWGDYGEFRYPRRGKVIVDVDYSDLEKEVESNMVRYRNLRYIGKDGIGFSLEEIKNHAEYPFDYLREGLQNQILESLNTLLVTSDLNNKERYELLTFVMCLPKDVLLVLQNFDHTKTAPKLVLYHSNAEQPMYTVGYLMEFLHEIGCDVIVLVPSGYRNVENILFANKIEEHRLSDLKPDLALPEIQQRRVTDTPNVTENRSIFKRIGKFFNT